MGVETDQVKLTSYANIKDAVVRCAKVNLEHTQECYRNLRLGILILMLLNIIVLGVSLLIFIKGMR